MKTEDRNRAKIARALLYIEAGLSEPLRVSEIAGQAHLPLFHFQRLFCAYMGESVSQYALRAAWKRQHFSWKTPRTATCCTWR